MLGRPKAPAYRRRVVVDRTNFPLPEWVRFPIIQAPLLFGFADVQIAFGKLDRSQPNLGIFMPHMHDEQTGELQPLPDNVMQVEPGLEVSFQPTAEIANQTYRFLPVGWCRHVGQQQPWRPAK